MPSSLKKCSSVTYVHISGADGERGDDWFQKPFKPSYPSLYDRDQSRYPSDKTVDLSPIMQVNFDGFENASALTLERFNANEDMVFVVRNLGGFPCHYQIHSNDELCQRSWDTIYREIKTSDVLLANNWMRASGC